MVKEVARLARCYLALIVVREQSGPARPENHGQRYEFASVAGPTGP